MVYKYFPRFRKRRGVRHESYIKSEDWKKKRYVALRIAGGKCQKCGSTENLQVHHTHYVTLGREVIERDLIVLCQNCHTKFHLGIHPWKFIKESKCEKCGSEKIITSFTPHSNYSNEPIYTDVTIKCEECKNVKKTEISIGDEKEIAELKEIEKSRSAHK